MRKLQLLLLIVSAIVLASCTETTKNVTTVEKATATAQATSSSSGGNATATASASAQATVVKTTTVTKDDDDSYDGGNSSNNSTDVDNYNCNCSATYIKRGRTITGTFAIRFLSGMMNWNCENITGAPLTTLYSFALIGMYTKNNSMARNQILNFTGMPDLETLRCVYEYFNTFLEDPVTNSTHKCSANVEANYCDNFTEKFKYETEKFLLGNAFNFNSRNVTDALLQTNNVIANDTENYVQNAVQCSDIFQRNCSIGKKLIFASGEYFTPKWRREFVPAGKKNYTDMNNKTSLVDYVMQCDTYKYVNSSVINAQVIVVDSTLKSYQIVFFIPNKECTMEAMLQELAYENNYLQVMNSLVYTRMSAYFPEYSSVSNTIDNVDLVKQMGGLDAFFDPNTAEIFDAYGKKTMEYIEAGSSTVFFENTLVGDESNNNDECAGDNAMEIVFDRPAAYIVSRKDVIVLCGIAKVDT